MSEDREMVFSTCVTWLSDWLEVDSPVLVDEWDMSNWMEYEMKDAIQTFLSFGFKTQKARADALVILRALLYEYFLFQRQMWAQRVCVDMSSVERLPKLLQSTQKSAAWHNESREMLSGHEFGPICVGSYSERSNVLAKKCVPEVVLSIGQEIESRIVFLTTEDGKLSAFKWGWRYEPVARQLFEQCISDADGIETVVYDGLGRIRHPTLPRLGASPDGLIMKGKRMGRLLEIKCPITREIDNKVPLHYYCQMQLQAEVCDVDAVEYLEVQFAAVAQDKVDETILNKAYKPWIGKICVCAATAETIPDEFTYAYSPLFPATAEGLRLCKEWTPEGILHESSIWYVKNYFHTTVLRNKRWWDAVGYPSYMDFWKDVDRARQEGRYKPQALFIDSASEGSGGLADVDTDVGREETGQISYNTAVCSDGTSSDGKNVVVARSVVGWQGVE